MPRSAPKFPGLRRHAKALGTSHVQLWRVLTGRRKSVRLMNDYNDLVAWERKEAARQRRFSDEQQRAAIVVEDPPPCGELALDAARERGATLVTDEMRTAAALQCAGRESLRPIGTRIPFATDEL